MTDNQFTGQTTGGESPASLDNVTREQGGQFIDEGTDLIRFGDPLEDLTDVEADARLMDANAERVNALQVTMDRSGAEFIHAQKAFLTNSGAKEITGTSSKLIQSGVLQLTTDTAEFHQSSAVMAKADSMSIEKGSVVFATADEMTVDDGAYVSVMQSREVKADGDVRAFMLFSNDVRAGGNVSSTLTTGSAAAFGAAFGAAVVLLSKVFGRRNG